MFLSPAMGEPMFLSPAHVRTYAPVSCPWDNLCSSLLPVGESILWCPGLGRTYAPVPCYGRTYISSPSREYRSDA